MRGIKFFFEYQQKEVLINRCIPHDKTGNHKKDVATFVQKHNLPVKDIIFTNGKYKADTLERIGSVLQYDDDTEEISRIKSKGIKVIHIKHPLD